jgi:hypothetical protein
MNLTNKIAIAVASSLFGMLGTATAQIETLSPEQIAEYRKRLPEAAQTTTVTAYKSYLQNLQRSLVTPGVEDQDKSVTNAVRVASDLKAVNAAPSASFLHYAVPAMSALMRLPDAYPTDGKPGGDVGIVMAQDEYEPASFVMHAFSNIEKAELRVSDLKSADGTLFPKENLDLKVVKVWYQNGNGWFSYFQDVGLELVPELLVHDENLIRVDLNEKANYARVNDEGRTDYIWISAPKKVDVPFDPYAHAFADAKTLQPVSLVAGQFKQFVLTAHATADTKPGNYRGSIQVTAAGQPTSQIPVAVRVLPFRLPLPKANYDVNKDFLVTLMGAWPRVDADHKAFMPTLRNLREHNILHLGPNVGPSTPVEDAAKNVRAMKEAGFQTDFIISGNLPWRGEHDGTPLTFDELMDFKRSAKAWREFYTKHFGHANAAIALGDEQGAAWVMKTRPAWRILNEEGLKSNLAGHDHIFVKGGYMLDIHPTAGSPSEKEKAETWRAVGHGHVGFYASQHNGSENPAFVRRQHGLLGYLSDFDMVDNYEFAYGPWNDRSTEVYKPMVLAYPTSEGLVDTLAWEGFREGIDDIRYATKLRQLADEAIASGNLDRIYEGRKVRQWFVLMDGEKIDLNSARLEMIQKIEKLLQLSAAQ